MDTRHGRKRSLPTDNKHLQAMSHNQMKETESIENDFNGKHINSGSTKAIPGEISGSSLSILVSSHPRLPGKHPPPSAVVTVSVTCRPRRLRIFGSSIIEDNEQKKKKKKNPSPVCQLILRSVLSPGAWIDSSPLLSLHLLLLLLLPGASCTTGPEKVNSSGSRSPDREERGQAGGGGG